MADTAAKETTLRDNRNIPILSVTTDSIVFENYVLDVYM